MLTTNEKLADRTIRHAIFLERLKATQVNKIVRLVNASNKDVFNILEKRLANIATRGFDTGTFATQRLRQLAVSTGTLVRAGARNASGVLKKDLQAIALSEADFQIKMFKDIVPLDLSFVTPSGSLLQSIVTKRPFQGKLLKQWFDDFGTNTQKNIITQLNIGLVQGETIPQLVNRLRTAGGVADKSRKEVARIVRTAVNHTTTQARELTYEANKDVVKGVQWLSTLDRRTSEICITLDGKVYPVGKGQRPPAHLQCRSTTTPILKSFEELGLPFKEIEPGTRASMNGQVPAKINYKQWLRKQPKNVQNEVLGVGKAKLFRSGKLKLDTLPVDGRPLTLQQLQVKEGLISPSIASPIPVSPVAYKPPDPNLLNLNAPKQLKNMMELGKVTGLNQMEIGAGLDTIHLQTATAHTRWMKDAFPKFKEAVPGSVNKVRFYKSSLPGTQSSYQGLFNYQKKILSIGNTKGQVATANNTLGAWSVDNSVAGTFRHEMGHAMDQFQGLKDSGPKNWEVNVWSKMTQSEIKKTVSSYAATNERELWAESFCAWTNPTYAIKGKRLPKLIEDFFESALGKHPNLTVTPKPIVVPKLPVLTKIVEPPTFGVVKPISKTPIKKTVIKPVKINKVPPPSEQLGSQVINKLKVKDQIALFNELEATGVTGPRLEAAKAAIMDTGTQTAIIRRSTGQIEGAISFYTKEGELVISNIGSLGRVNGGGTELLRVAIRKAAKGNLGMTFEAAESAIPYFQKIGFSTSGKIVSASPARVKQMRTALGKRGRSIANPTGKGASTTKALRTTTPNVSTVKIHKTKNTSEWLNSLSTNERTAIRSYTGSGYVDINQKMAGILKESTGTGAFDVAVRKELQETIASIKAAMDRRPPLKQKALWRGMGWKRGDNGIKQWITEGAEIDVKSFFSSSNRESFAESWTSGKPSRVILKIVNPKNAVDVRKISGLGEGEFIFAPQKYKVLSVKQTRRPRVIGTETQGFGAYEVEIQELGIEAVIPPKVVPKPKPKLTTKQWVDSLDKKEKSAIKGYTNENWEPINKWMQGKDVRGFSDEALERSSDRILSALEKHGNLSEKEVFRGMNWKKGDKRIKAFLKEGNEIDIESFWSTTTDKATLQGSGRFGDGPEWVEIKILNPKTGANIKDLSVHASEDEFLLAPGKFRIKSVKQVSKEGTFGGYEVVVEAL